ncbi:MAG: hypothetical protein AB7G75_05330 [Candidatus Binatia bacterium]
MPSDFAPVLFLAIMRLRQAGCVTSHALRHACGVDEAVLEDVREERILTQQVAHDKHEKVLI